MESRSLEKAVEIYSKLIIGEEISRKNKTNCNLYEEYIQNAEVNENVSIILKKLNLHIYEYNETLYVSPGEGNKVFGYSNDELKKIMGLRYNKELYLCYFIIYNIILQFYNDSASFQYIEYIKIEDTIEKVSNALATTMKEIDVLIKDDVIENSFKTVAILWDELPMVTDEENSGIRASRSSKMGYVKNVFNFLQLQSLFVDVEERYYPTDRLKALIRNYFEEYRGQLYQLIGGNSQDATN